jgi:hypothetical protein
MTGAVVSISMGLLLRSDAAVAKTVIDVSNDTITCNTVIGSVKLQPAFGFTPNATDTLQVKGTLDGCTDTSNSAVKILPSKFKGVLTTNNVSCLSLAGTVAGSGTITVGWKSNSLVCSGGTNAGQPCTVATEMTDCPGTGGGKCAKAALSQKSSIISIVSLTPDAGLAPGGSFGAADYGVFDLGVQSVTGAFTGGDGGTTTTSYLVTGNDVGSLANSCAAGTLKLITFGIGTITLQ